MNANAASPVAAAARATFRSTEGPLGATSDEVAGIAAGLLAAAARIAPKYLYDALGCRLFELITQLPEYYPTRVERDLLTDHACAIAEAVGHGGSLIDLGAGNCDKARLLLPALQPADYLAVDISTDFVARALSSLRMEFPGIRMKAVGADLDGELELPASLPRGGRLFFYPGSSIGNFDPDAARQLLGRIHRLCTSGDALLLGIDLVKDKAVLDAAYNDALGLTAAFNRNVLNHVNVVLGSDFDTRDWRHQAFYNCARGRIEMHLQAVAAVAVAWPGGERLFLAGEGIHTENSYKYRLADVGVMLAHAGFSSLQTWTDERQWYALCLARA